MYGTKSSAVGTTTEDPDFHFRKGYEIMESNNYLRYNL